MTRQRKTGHSRITLATLALMICGQFALAQDVRVLCIGQQRWSFVEAGNFRIRWRTNPVDLKNTLKRLEYRRSELCARWTSNDPARTWAPRCEIILHESDREFTRRTGRPADMLAFSELEVGDGRVWRRTIHARADAQTSVTTLLEHELVHIVLADRFTKRQIPRWADEGIAVAEEQSDRKTRLVNLLADEVEVNRHFPMQDIFAATRYPNDSNRADLFYAQSASLIEFLIARGGPAKVLRFVEQAASAGAQTALSRDYSLHSLQEAERAWLAWRAESHNATPEPAKLTTLEPAHDSPTNNRES